LLPEVDEHLVEKKFGEFKVNLPEVGEVQSQFYVPPRNGQAVGLRLPYYSPRKQPAFLLTVVTGYKFNRAAIFVCKFQVLM
jgi:hypothetical protein